MTLSDLEKYFNRLRFSITYPLLKLAAKQEFMYSQFFGDLDFLLMVIQHYIARKPIS